MVRIRDDEPPSQEPIEGANVHGPGDQANVQVAGEQANEREDYMFFLREQLEEFLPPHDKKQDDFIAKLPNLLFLPDNSSDEIQRIYHELCGKQARLLKIQKERIEITTWLWCFYKQELPNIPLQQAKKKVRKLFAGKQKFYVISKQVEDALYKLHAITPTRVSKILSYIVQETDEFGGFFRFLGLCVTNLFVIIFCCAVLGGAITYLFYSC